jgi:hypothetical protein
MVCADFEGNQEADTESADSHPANRQALLPLASQYKSVAAECTSK